MDQKQIEALLAKSRKGILRDEEKTLLESWYNFESANSRYDINQEDLEKNLAIVAAELPLVYDKPVRRLWPRVAKAAAAILILGAGIFYYNSRGDKEMQNFYANDIAPGGNKATITLASGKRILLTGAADGKLASEGPTTISKTASGTIVYSGDHSPSPELSYDVLTTPKGGQYAVTLSDGTKVILNAESSLRYPSAFGRSRNVELTGEAYFEVTHDKNRPFTVTSNGQQVRVLGTHFNVNCYADERCTRTTLLEGSVRLNGHSTLVPGQQAVFAGTGKISVFPVNADETIAWTNGRFIFDNETIESIMRKLARWYDIDVTYEGDVKNKAFAGTIGRKDNISKILDKIAFTQAAHFKIEGRRVTVMP